MTAETATPVKLVYAGRREATGGKQGAVFYPMNEDSTLGKPVLYVVRKTPSIIGGVYVGAKMDLDTDKRTVYGLDLIRYSGMYEADPVAVAGWHGLDHEYDKTIASERAQKKYVDPIRAGMLEFRRTMHALHKRGAHAEAQAYRDLIFAEMYRPLTAQEKGDA